MTFWHLVFICYGIGIFIGIGIVLTTIAEWRYEDASRNDNISSRPSGP